MSQNETLKTYEAAKISLAFFCVVIEAREWKSKHKGGQDEMKRDKIKQLR